MSEPQIITWLDGVSYTKTEARIEGDALVMGYRINGGEFRPTASISGIGTPGSVSV